MGESYTCGVQTIKVRLTFSMREVYFFFTPLFFSLGKLGVGDYEDRSAPTLVSVGGGGGVQVKDVEIGGIHAATIAVDNQLYTFGCGSDGIFVYVFVRERMRERVSE